MIEHTQKLLDFLKEQAIDMRKYANKNLSYVRTVSNQQVSAGQYAGILGECIGDALTYINKRAELIEGVLMAIDPGMPEDLRERFLEQRLIIDAKTWRTSD